MISHILLLVTLCHVVLSSPTTTAPIETTTEKVNNAYYESGYIITPGIGAHKYHRTRVDWNEARKICISEGAHLAVINSALEESIIAKYQYDHGLSSSWIGYHDQFEDRNWVTVMDQAISAVGYFPNWKVGEPNNAGGNERCVTYDVTGMNDLGCEGKNTFICKLYLK